MLGIFLRALRAALRDASPGAPAAVRDAQLGAISFPQRFGSSLNPHYHYHVLALDGVISGDVERGVRFHEASGLEARDAEALARAVQLRVLRWFARRGLLDPSAAADMRTWRGTGGFSVECGSPVCSWSDAAVSLLGTSLRGGPCPSTLEKGGWNSYYPLPITSEGPVFRAPPPFPEDHACCRATTSSRRFPLAVRAVCRRGARWPG